MASSRPGERRASIDIAERMFDLGMMILFGVLGVIFTGLGIMMPSAWSIVGGLLVLAAIIPLRLAGRSSAGDRSARPLRWYPPALILLVLGIVLWIHPWTGF